MEIGHFKLISRFYSEFVRIRLATLVLFRSLNSISVFCDMTPYLLLKSCRRFASNMAVGSSETFTTLCKSSRRLIPEDLNHHHHHHHHHHHLLLLLLLLLPRLPPPLLLPLLILLLLILFIPPLPLLLLLLFSSSSTPL